MISHMKFGLFYFVLWPVSGYVNVEMVYLLVMGGCIWIMNAIVCHQATYRSGEKGSLVSYAIKLIKIIFICKSRMREFQRFVLSVLAAVWTAFLFQNRSDGWRKEVNSSSASLCFCRRWNLSFVVAAQFSCYTTALFIKREAACSKLLQIITICLQSPELSSKPAPILPSNFLSQNWTCGSLCVTTSLPSPGLHCTFSQYFFSHFRRVIAEHQPLSSTGENIMPSLGISKSVLILFCVS